MKNLLILAMLALPLALTVGCLTTQFWVPGADFGRGFFQLNASVPTNL